MIKIDHFTINVINMQDSIAFYSNVLGFRNLGNIDMGDSMITYFELPGETRLELIDTYDESTLSSNTQLTRGCYRHLAFEVNDLDSYYKNFSEKGIDIVMKPTPLPQLSCRAMLIHDPNHVEIELMERL